MMGDTSLLIFSLCMQMAVGIVIFAFLGEILFRGKRFKTAILIAAILGVVGVIASLTHLGHPLAALNVLSRFGKSWLSTQAVLSGVFAGLAILYALALYTKPDNKNASLALGGIGSIVGLIVVYSMGKVYAYTSVSAWQGTNTFVDFYATTIALGAILFLVASVNELKGINKKIFGYAILAAVVIQAASAVPHVLSLNEMGFAAHNSMHILNGMSGLIWAKWLLILGGAGIAIKLIFADQAAEAQSNLSAFYTGGTALVIGQIIGRYLFYAALVASSVGIV